MNGAVNGLLIQTATATASLLHFNKAAKKMANTIWTPMVGEKAIKTPKAKPSAISRGSPRSLRNRI